MCVCVPSLGTMYLSLMTVMGDVKTGKKKLQDLLCCDSVTLFIMLNTSACERAVLLM